MTDRVRGFVVTLEKDLRDDDVADIVTAIGMVRGVVSCKPKVTDVGDIIAEQRAHADLAQRVDEMFRKFFEDHR